MAQIRVGARPEHDPEGHGKGGEVREHREREGGGGEGETLHQGEEAGGCGGRLWQAGGAIPEDAEGRYDTSMCPLAPALLAALLPLAASGAPPAEPVAFVVCAPGYPGSTAEAQPVMDALAAALADATGWGRGRVTAEYYEDEARGLERLARADAAFALVPLAFFLKHEAALQLAAEAQVVAEGGRAEETWSLVAGKGRVSRPQALDGWEILTSVGYAPRFVRGTALGGWGGAPPGAKVVASGTVLSGLRRAAAGERVALLLDSVEAAALPTLPFAKDLDVVTRSAPVPATVVCAVKKRASAAQVEEAVQALFDLRRRSSGAAALSAMRTEGFVPLDQQSLDRARAAYAAAKEAP